MAKKKAKKTKKSVRKQVRKKKENHAPLIIGIIILIVAIIGVVILLNKSPAPTEEEQPSETLAVVNGEEITQTDIDLRRSLQPQVALTDDALLAQLIDEKLLLQEAERRNLAADEQEVDASFQILMQQGGLSEEQIDANLAVYGLDRNDLRELIKEQLSIIKILNASLDERVIVTEEDVQAYYEERKDQFYSEGTATVRHVLVQVNEETDEETARETIQGVSDQYDNGRDMCDLVTEFSDDSASVSQCGQYTFAKGVMVAPFEEAAFDMKEGETRIVQSPFGFHFMVKLLEAEGRQLDIEDVADAIRGELRTRKQLEAYQGFITELRTSADIEGFEYPAAPTEEVAAPEENTQPSTPPEETAPPPSGGAETFEGCLTENGVKLFIATWDPVSQRELTKFDNVDDLMVVDCTDDAPGCTGIEAYPTWLVNGEQLLGEQSLETLARLTGCEQ